MSAGVRCDAALRLGFRNEMNAPQTLPSGRGFKTAVCH